MLNKKTIYFVFILLGLIIASALVIYILNFKDSNISNSTQDWGSFLDYFGGVANVTIGVANIILIYYISVLISKHDDRRFINQIVYELFSEFNTHKSKLDFQLYNSKSQKEFSIFVLNFGTKNSYLFEKNEDEFFDLCFQIASSLSRIDIWTQQYSDRPEETKDITVFTNKYLKREFKSEDEEIGYKLLSLEMFIFNSLNTQLLKFLKDTISNKRIKSTLIPRDRKEIEEQWNRHNEMFINILNAQDQIRKQTNS